MPMKTIKLKKNSIQMKATFMINILMKNIKTFKYLRAILFYTQRGEHMSGPLSIMIKE